MTERAQRINNMLLNQAPNTLRNNFHSTCIGEVVDVADPQQMGRVRARCPILGDNRVSDVTQIPWAQYCAPMGGVADLKKGNDDDSSLTTYGFWNIPKIGAQVVIQCIDGDASQRIWIGCLYRFQTPAGLPHGSADPDSTGIAPGVRDVAGKSLEPLQGNNTTAFKGPNPNFEYQSRGLDRNASRVDQNILSSIEDTVVAEGDVDILSANYKTGYQPNRAKNAPTNSPDSQIYSWTTPGFHSISMDDSADHGRIRIRSCAGSQVLIDDTNERIYVSTAAGAAWVEIDYNGNIDVYSDRRISFHAKKDINFTTDTSFRVTASSIHMNATGDIRSAAGGSISSKSTNDTKMESGASFNIKAASDIKIAAGASLHLKASSDIKASAGASTYLKSTQNFNLNALSIKSQSTNDTNFTASSIFAVTAATISMNQTPAIPPTPGPPSDPANPDPPFLTNRKPEHESFARTMTKDDFTHEPEFSYDDPNVGRVERGESIIRNKNWKR